MATVDPRVSDLAAAPKSRWLLAWLAAAPDDTPQPRAAFAAANTHPRETRLRGLRDNPEGLLLEAHTRIRDWRHHQTARDTLAGLGPAHGYHRIATALLTAPAAAWWWQPLDRRSQTWICTDPGIRSGTGLPFTTNYGHHWDATAPTLALTTSTRLPRLAATALLCDQNRPRTQRTNPRMLSAWDLPVKDTARVYEIHGADDWTSLVARYPSHRSDFCHAPHLLDQWPTPNGHPVVALMPDWRAVSADYDAVHLSMAGWLTATSRVLQVPSGGYTFCEGWRSESTVFFRPVFSHAFEELTDAGHLEYGYGPGVADVDLATPPVVPRRPWWRRLLPAGRA